MQKYTARRRKEREVNNMNQPELISIIVPVYKVEKYLDKCVESIVEQTYKNLEIILVDDGSPDNCPAMCDRWLKRIAESRLYIKKTADSRRREMRDSMPAKGIISASLILMIGLSRICTNIFLISA